ncbi:MAG: DUF1573 domain-containing protein [Flavobacteriales bacterium]
MMTLRLNLLLASCMLVSFLVAQDDQVTGRPTAEFQFEAMEHDFGWVLQDSRNPHVFTFKNTGNVPLIIESAVGSCGCTVPRYHNAPILPGEEGEIEVVYSPGKQEGHQLKTVTVIANTKPAQTLLRIHAEVLTADPGVPSEAYTFEPLPPPVDPGGDTQVYVDGEMVRVSEQAMEDVPVEPATFDPLNGRSTVGEKAHGPTTELRFEEMEHDFGQIPQGSENPHVFRFKNTGTVPLIIENAIGSCGCTVPFYAKDPIMPGEESEIHVVYKPGKQEGTQQKTVTITANTAPGETQLKIRAEVLVVDSVTAPSLFVIDEEHEKERTAIETVSPGCFVIFPNPTSSELRLDLKEHIGRSAQVRIHDQTGREMLQTRIADINSETSRLDVASFPGGIYVVTIQVEDGQPMSQCFVVSK